MSSIKLGAGLLAGVSMFAVTTAALAQSADAPASEIVVTGSRIVTNGNNSPTPVTVVSTDTIRTVQPTTLADGLNLLPVFSSSRSQSANPSATGAVGGGNGAANQLNLRSLGSNRTLVLLDGRRVPPASTTNIVDVDIIPEMLIQRVDVVTGGVSAVYGSDAVTGVVNYITDRNFNGFKANAQFGVTQYGDSQTEDLGLAFGSKLFDGRGHFEGSLSYYNDKGVTRRSDRSWYNQQTVGGLGTAAAPYQMFSNVRLAQTPFGGLIVGGPAALVGMNFKTDGNLTTFTHGTPTGGACCEVGGDGGYFDSNMKTPLLTRQAYGRFDYDFGGDLHFFAVVGGDFKDNPINADTPILNAIQLSSQNPFLAPALRTQLATGGTTFKLSKILNDVPRYAPDAHEDQYIYTFGLDGKLGAWNWGVNYTGGSSTLTTVLKNNPNLEREAAALDAVTNSSGQIVCNTDITNPGLRPGCTPFNPFGPTAASAAAINYIVGTTTYISYTKTQDLSGQITGAPFSTWAGPVQLALSSEWRSISYQSSTDGSSALLADCTGIRYNCVAGTTHEWGQAFAGGPLVSQKVTEGAAEVNIPLLKDAPFARSLNVTGAARYTNYDTSGSYWTYKAGLEWTVTDEFRIRGTGSRDIRAPTLDDLFSPASFNFQTQQDLLTGLSPRVGNTGGGNPNLKAEIGYTVTAGFVWRPTAIPGFSLSMDAYSIRVEGAITAVQGFNPVIQRACYDSKGSSPYCQQQTRPLGNYTNTTAANAVTGWSGTTINIASIRTQGIDAEANYQTRLLDRPTSFRFLAAYQPHIYYVQPALPTTDMGGVAFGPNGLLATPTWRLTGFFHMNLTDQFGFDLVEKWHNSLKLSGDPTQTWINNHVDAYGVTNVTLSYDMRPSFVRTQLFFNVQNLFNSQTPIAGYFGNVAVPGVRDGWISGDNPIGRYMTVGVRVRH